MTSVLKAGSVGPRHWYVEIEFALFEVMRFINDFIIRVIYLLIMYQKGIHLYHHVCLILFKQGNILDKKLSFC